MCATYTRVLCIFFIELSLLMQNKSIRMLKLEQSTFVHVHGNGLKKIKPRIRVCKCLTIYVVCSLHTGFMCA